jgi:OTU domain-containing protein 6
MTKGSKRAKIKQALSPVRNLSPSALKSPSPSNHVTSPPPLEDLADEDQDDLINDLMAELDSRDKTVQVEAATVLQEIKMDGAVNGNSTSESSQNRKKDSKSRHQARQVCVFPSGWAPDRFAGLKTSAGTQGSGAH